VGAARRTIATPIFEEVFMHVRFTHALIAATLAATAAGGAQAQPRALRLVAIQESAAGSTMKGVGILRPRYTGECFVVTPRHVADPLRGGIAGFRAFGRGSSRDTLVPVPERFSSDVALWRMARRMDRSNCPDWPSVADVNRTLERAARIRRDAMVLPWTTQGAGLPVNVIMDQTTLTVTQFTVRQTGEALQEGMSGSPVQIDGVVVGILTEVITDDRGGSRGVVLRLDYLEHHIGYVFHPSPSPDDAAIYASVLLPGLGQGRTRRGEAGLFWFGLAAGPTAYLFFETRNQQVARTRALPDGREETYFETRPVNPHRRYSWIPWLAAGLGSFVEARARASRDSIPPERSGVGPARGAHAQLRPDLQPTANGGMRVQVGELRF
jgi:hypothetical protein